MDRLPVDLLQSVRFSTTPARAYHAAASNNIILAAWRRWGLICGCAAVSLVVAAAALSAMTKQYTAEAVLQLNFDRHESGPAEERGPAVVLDAAAMVQGELKIIRSRLIARRVVERLHLADDPVSPPSRLAGLVSAVAPWLNDGLQAIWPRGAGEGEVPAQARRPGAGGDKAAERAEIAEDDVLSRMTAESDNRSYLLTLKFTSGDPDRAARTVNAIAEEYIARRLEANISSAAKTSEWLDGQIRQTTMQLQDAEATVLTYRAQSGLLELGSSETLDQQRLRDLAIQRNAALLARNEAEGRLRRVQEAASAGAVPSADDLRGSPQIRSLLDRRVEARSRLNVVLADLGSKHPQAILALAAVASADAAIAAEMRRATTIAQGELDAAQRNEQEIGRRLDALQQAMIAGKGNEAELRSRQAATQILRDRLAALTRSRDQAQAIQQLRPVAATLLVPAERPRAPVSPKPIVVVPLALTGGLGFGLLLANLLERRDRGFQTGAEVEPALGRRCLGMVPEARSAIAGRGGRRAAFEASLLTETVLSVCASVGMFSRRHQCPVVLVTSSVADEGKSVFCRTLAESMVGSGRRVLLVDGSPRRDAARTDATVGSPAAFGVSRGRGLPGLVVLQRSGAALLAGNAFGTTEFSNLLEETREHFDLVLIEGPPVMLVADSLVLGRLADTVILLARWSGTKRATVAAALARLQESSIAVEGVVLSRVDLARHAALKPVDIGAHYLKERRFYERLARPAPPATTESSRDI